jgi:hypothetical protein
MLQEGDVFEDVPLEEFMEINKKANAVGLMALVLDMDEEEDPGISFVLIPLQGRLH